MSTTAQHTDPFFSCLIFILIRKRSLSESSNSSSEVSLGGSRYHHSKSRSKKMDEVERLAEMERQRRQKEVEQKVCCIGTPRVV